MAHMPIDCRKPIFLGESGYLLSMTWKQNVRQDEEAVCALSSHCLEGSVDLAGLTHL